MIVLIGVAIGIVLMAVLYYNNVIFNFSTDKEDNSEDLELMENSSATKFGYLRDSFYFDTRKIKKNDALGSILYWQDVDFSVIKDVIEKSKGVIDVKSIVENNNYTLVRKNECGELLSLVYEPDKFSYVIFNLEDSVYVKKVYRDIDTKIEYAEGEVESSLWNAMVDLGLNSSLIDKMEDALASEVDFYHAQKGDKFKLLFEKKYINGKPVAIGNLIGAIYTNSEPNTAIYFFDNGTTKGYYNEKSFLQ
ncbi:MAG: hypothetical protein R2771_05955 [Saprospiraceae bacterium]